MFEQLDQDVQDAVEEYDRALVLERKAKTNLSIRLQIEDGDLIPTSKEDKELAKKTVEKVQKAYRRKGKDRRDALEEYEKRVKTRDTKTLEWNSCTMEKKVNEIQFDGQTYTTRWSALPA